MNRKTIEVNHVAGFFSCCTVRLQSIINFYNENGYLPNVDSKKQWEWYADEQHRINDIDLTYEFFNKNEVTDYLKCDKLIFSTDDSEDQFSDYSKINFKELSGIVDLYFEPSFKIKTIISDVFFKNFNPDESISVFYRGNDKTRETNIPSYDDVLDKLDDIYEGEDIIVQTDDVNFYKKISSLYDVKVLYDSPMLNSIDNCVSKMIVDGDRLMYAILFLASVYTQSQSKKIITNSGNIGMWLALYRGNTYGFYQYLNPKEYIYGSYNKSYNKYKKVWLK